MSFGSSPSYNPPPPAPAPGLSPEEIAAKKAAEDMEKAKQKRKKGFSSTILTSAMGIGSEAPTEKKTLLGG